MAFKQVELTKENKFFVFTTNKSKFVIFYKKPETFKKFHVKHVFCKNQQNNLCSRSDLLPNIQLLNTIRHQLFLKNGVIKCVDCNFLFRTLVKQ